MKWMQESEFCCQAYSNKAAEGLTEGPEGRAPARDVGTRGTKSTCPKVFKMSLS